MGRDPLRAPGPGAPGPGAPCFRPAIRRGFGPIRCFFTADRRHAARERGHRPNLSTAACRINLAGRPGGARGGPRYSLPPPPSGWRSRGGQGAAKGPRPLPARTTPPGLVAMYVALPARAKFAQAGNPLTHSLERSLSHTRGGRGGGVPDSSSSSSRCRARNWCSTGRPAANTSSTCPHVTRRGGGMEQRGIESATKRVPGLKGAPQRSVPCLHCARPLDPA